ncbi:MAG TPA: transketolase C-terminal domain-containing protein, partial [Taishania sp.]|nr:transketolase C-terminal domain-containing protein [Taishania sp.]
KVITVEDGCLMGGFGSAIIEFMADNNYHVEIVRLGIPDKYINHGTQAELWAECGYDTAGIEKTVIKMLQLDNRAQVNSSNVG